MPNSVEANVDASSVNAKKTALATAALRAIARHKLVFLRTRRATLEALLAQRVFVLSLFIFTSLNIRVDWFG